jgi:serine/threonine protein kinase/Tol biopolymer transport system component
MSSETDKRLQTVKSVFLEALEKGTAEERTAYLDRACGDNAEFRRRIDSLLQAHEKAGSFLDPSVLGPSVTPDQSSLTEGPGTVIGRYKLLEKIGEGGMAVVYMAEQEEPIRRKVALKIIKLGMDTKQVIARFEAERQALAMMDHPNIAKVFDAGATDTGRPYFVMELVTGVSIAEYCDKKRLSTQERSGLFVEVCKAVQHAHQKGIIHRDIKPSNVMITLHDGKPVPKVIDFGIAKAMNQRLTEKTLFTKYAHMIGTPAYMSPEQAELSGLDVDTRTDIYSLGVLLYELLTGTTPISEEELREAGLVEMQRMIREDEPVKPSTKLTTLGQRLIDVAENRGASADTLRKLVRGDLDWIVMKALEKDRKRRYDTVAELAADVERHLNSEPVSAVAPSSLYRIRKFVKRHRVVVIAGVFVVAALVVGLSVALIALTEANRQWRRAEASYQRAWENLDAMYAFHWRDIAGGVSKTEKLELYVEMYRKRLEFLDWSLQRSGDDSEIRKDMGYTNKYMGVAYMTVLDKPEEAEFAYRRAISIFEELVRDFPEEKDLLMELGYCKSGLATVLQALDRPQEAQVEYDSSKVLLKSLPTPFRSGTPVNLGTTVNTPYVDAAPCMSADGLTLFFSSNRPDGLGDYDIWVANRERTTDSFENAKNLGPNVNSRSWDDGPSISRDGLTLYFCSMQGDGLGDFDLWMTTRATKDGEWSVAENLGRTVNTDYRDSMPYLSSDGTSLYFHSNRPGGLGGQDLWVAKREDISGDFGEPGNLGPNINSPYGDLHPFVSANELLLFFSSSRPHRPGSFVSGSYDLWVARRPAASEPWGMPMNLGPVINSAVSDTCPRLSPDGSMLLFSSRRPGGQGSWDIFYADIDIAEAGREVGHDAGSTTKTIQEGDGKEVIPVQTQE